MAKMYYEKDCNQELLQGMKVAVIGYGSQGHAHALNLMESGCDVTIGLYEGSRSWEKAQAAGLKVALTEDAVKAVLFIIRDAPYMTGTVLRIDGGYVLGGDRIAPMPEGVVS